MADVSLTCHSLPSVEVLTGNDRGYRITANLWTPP